MRESARRQLGRTRKRPGPCLRVHRQGNGLDGLSKGDFGGLLGDLLISMLKPVRTPGTEQNWLGQDQYLSYLRRLRICSAGLVSVGPTRWQVCERASRRNGRNMRTREGCQRASARPFPCPKVQLDVPGLIVLGYRLPVRRAFIWAGNIGARQGDEVESVTSGVELSLARSFSANDFFSRSNPAGIHARSSRGRLGRPPDSKRMKCPAR